MAIAQNLTLFKHPRNRPGLRAWQYSVVRNKTTDVMRRRLTLTWGVTAVASAPMQTTDEMLAAAATSAPPSSTSAWVPCCRSATARKTAG